MIGRPAHRLVTSHLRFVSKLAAGYKGYGLPLEDLIAEGNLGPMHAVKKFDPDKGFRLSTYAFWWIKATIQDYILRFWSLVKIGTTAVQKRLFFSLNRLKNKIQAPESENGDLRNDQIKQMAVELNISAKVITKMEQRIKGSDFSLNAPFVEQEERREEWQDLVVDESPTAEEMLVHENDDVETQKSLLAQALSNLSEREAYIIKGRRLGDLSQTLETISVTIRQNNINPLITLAYFCIHSKNKKFCSFITIGY